MAIADVVLALGVGTDMGVVFSTAGRVEAVWTFRVGIEMVEEIAAPGEAVPEDTVDTARGRGVGTPKVVEVVARDVMPEDNVDTT